MWKKVYKNINDLIKNHEILYFLFLRNFKARYKQSFLGAAWAIIQPVIMMIIFTLVFSKIGKFPSDGLPYPVFSYANLLPWTFFSKSITSAVTSLTGHNNLITKIRFPNLVIPISSILLSVVDTLLGTIILFVLMMYYKISIPIQVFWVVPALGGVFFLSAGISFMGSALNVFYRDVNFTLPLVMQVWMYMCPIIYPVSAVPEKYVGLYMLNPMSSFLYTYQGALFGKHGLDLHHLIIASCTSMIVFLTGVIVFSSFERKFADII